MLKEKLLSRVSIDPNGCWIWTRAKNKDGYGYLFYEGKMQRVTRLSYALFNGNISDNKLVLHKCDNPSCINPEHLFLGTHADNANDRNSKGRQAKGERHANAKVKERAVFLYKSLRHLAMNAGFGKVVGTKVAMHHSGLNHSTATHINAGRRWRHINIYKAPKED